MPDYGHGLTNIDTETGIRYGVIHHRELGQSWYESSEADYGKPHCPKCGNEAVEFFDEEHEDYDVIGSPCSEYACESCELTFDGSEAFGDDPLRFNFEDEEYAATQGREDCDIFVVKSPYYTLCAWCSPCAPGAGYLTSEGSVKAYCFGPEWFENNKPPYSVFRVADDECIYRKEDDETA